MVQMIMCRRIIYHMAYYYCSLIALHLSYPPLVHGWSSPHSDHTSHTQAVFLVGHTQMHMESNLLLSHFLDKMLPSIIVSVLE